MNYKLLIKALSLSSLLLLTLFVFTNCSKDDDDDNSSSKVVNAGNDVAPAWEVSNTKPILSSAPTWTPVDDELDISSSMTMTCKIVNSKGAAKVADGDKLAAFIDGKCVGVANMSNLGLNGNRFFLYINNFIEPADNIEFVTLMYYSATQKTTTRWETGFSFVKDAILGTVTSPVELNVDDSDDYEYFAFLFMGLPTAIADHMSADDEIAIFVDGNCRVIKGDNLTTSIKSQILAEIIDIYGDEFDYSGIIPDNMQTGVTYLLGGIPLNTGEEEVTVKYYSASLTRIFTFDPIKINAEEINFYQVNDVKYK